MRGLGKSGALTACLLALTAGQPALSEPVESLGCGEDLSRAVLVNVIEVSDMPSHLAEALPRFDAAAASCPDNDFAVHYAAAGHLTRAFQLIDAQAGNEDVMTEWHTAFGYSTAYWQMDEHDDLFEAQDGTLLVDVEVTTEQASALREDLVRGMLEFQARYALPQPYIIGPDWPEACHDGLARDIRAARGWLDENPGGEGLVLQFAEKVAAVCPLEQPTRDLHFSLNAIRLSAARAVASRDPQTARAIAKKVAAYRDIMLSSESSRLYWSQDRQAALDEIEALASGAGE